MTFIFELLISIEKFFYYLFEFPPMIILEIIILLIGFIISLLSLPKQNSKKNKSKRILASLYILFCVFSFLLIIFKSEDTEESGLKLFSSLNAIEKVITAQSDTLINLMDSINAIKVRMDNIVNKTEEAIIQREQSQKIFDEQNRLLEKSNELTQKQFEDTKPDVTIYTHGITYYTVDSIIIKFKLIFNNEGERVARNFKHVAVQFYRDKINNNFFSHFISLGSETEIYPSKRLLAEKPLSFNHQDFHEQTSGGIIIVLFSYFDDLLIDRIENQLFFRFETEIDTIKVFKENKIPNDLQKYLSKNKIKLTID